VVALIGVSGAARLAGRDDNGLLIVQVTDAAGRWDATVQTARPGR
jgi:hypothetical protein